MYAIIVTVELVSLTPSGNTLFTKAFAASFNASILSPFILPETSSTKTKSIDFVTSAVAAILIFLTTSTVADFSIPLIVAVFTILFSILVSIALTLNVNVNFAPAFKFPLYDIVPSL